MGKVMENSYYILTKEKVIIERLHICTWEFPRASSYIEFGLEFPYDSFTDDYIEFYLAAPFIKKGDFFKCLQENLSNRENGRFIFNDVVRGIENVGDDPRDGSILNFETRGNITVLPCEAKAYKEYVLLKIKKPSKYKGSAYFRVLVKIEKNSIAINKKGIAKTTYIYDFKINETRNLPQSIYDLKKDKVLNICEVKNFFCLHIVPDSFMFSFIDSSKLKNIRKLESWSFQKYLPDIKDINRDCYNIIFLKDNNNSGKRSYSMFTMCTEEIIGFKQIALAIGANILCNLLFAFSSLRFAKDPQIEWYRQIPWEYWAALAILLILCIYPFIPLIKKMFQK